MQLIPENKIPFQRSYWVVPGKLLAGCYPGARQADEAARRLENLLNAGIRCFINLMEDYETDWQGEDLRHYEEQISVLAEKKGLEIECVRIPVPETSIPTFAVMKRILDKIDRSIEGDRSVYLHCWGGKGRTGTVVGCYLVRHGMAAGKDALGMISRLRKAHETCNEPSPENERQRWMVYSWVEGE